jgi:hypothetical protein
VELLPLDSATRTCSLWNNATRRWREAAGQVFDRRVMLAGHFGVQIIEAPPRRHALHGMHRSGVDQCSRRPGPRRRCLSQRRGECDRAQFDRAAVVNDQRDRLAVPLRKPAAAATSGRPGDRALPPQTSAHPAMSRLGFGINRRAVRAMLHSTRRICRSTTCGPNFAPCEPPRRGCRRSDAGTSSDVARRDDAGSCASRLMGRRLIIPGVDPGATCRRRTTCGRRDR